MNSTKFATIKHLLQWAILLLPAASPAGPRAVIDTLQFDFGIVFEKKVKFLQHTFTIKNSGDSVLTIYKIKPGCDCTTFENDSVIAPGTAGRLTMRLDLSKVTDGSFYRELRASTNDPHYPKVRFGFTGTLRSAIYADLESILLPTLEKKDTVITVTLFTEKSDLQVTGVSFELKNTTAAWQPDFPIRFGFRKLNKKSPDGQWTYSLQVYYFPVAKECHYGTFVIATNHPEKREVRIAGALDPVK